MEYSNSKGELKLVEILQKENADFQREYSFPDLLGIKGAPLRFDFAVFEKGKIKFLIDFDGVQHYKYVPFFHKKESNFKRSLEWDRKKNKYCLIRGIKLIRVPYWDLDKLTYETLINTPEYVVKDKYHNDYLAKRVK